jgi:hypothetical protein
MELSDQRYVDARRYMKTRLKNCSAREIYPDKMPGSSVKSQLAGFSAVMN